MGNRRITVFQATLGVALVTIGVLLLVMQIFQFDPVAWFEAVVGGVPWAFIWPFFVIGVGLLLIAFGLAEEPLAFMLVPGSMVAMTGILLFFDNWLGVWKTWAYTWALVAPTSVGIGLLLWGARTGSPGLKASGRTTMMTGLGLFAAFAVLMEGVLGVGVLQAFGLQRYVFGVLLILLGLVLIFGRRRRGPAKPVTGEYSPPSQPQWPERPPQDREPGDGEPRP